MSFQRNSNEVLNCHFFARIQLLSLQITPFPAKILFFPPKYYFPAKILFSRQNTLFFLPKYSFSRQNTLFYCQNTLFTAKILFLPPKYSFLLSKYSFSRQNALFPRQNTLFYRQKSVFPSKNCINGIFMKTLMAVEEQESRYRVSSKIVLHPTQKILFRP